MESGIKTLKWALEGSSHASSRRMKKEPGNGHLSLNKQFVFVLEGLLRFAMSYNSRWNDYHRDKTDRGNFT
ncbi:hypothetical protein OsJ_36483 [Oryza sativa Japonica Group]|uniref:Uncharacterized protein n=1 Tax=Oryza sativa subsp. japonica TaxID=39947 RepID=A3CID3_ORYSJ|nr:hypothetical protein OsJ_36483 [Oryza sativa Japonica Group]